MLKTRVIVLGALVLAALGVYISLQPEIYDGIVLSKWHEEATTKIILMPMRIGDATYLMSTPVFDDEDWMIKIRNEERVYRYKVSKEVWESVEVGDQVDLKGKTL